MRSQGKIVSWNDDKGYGFVEPANGGKHVFIHIKAFSRRQQRPAINQVVSYTLSSDQQGRACAINARLAGDSLIQAPTISNGTGSVLLAVLFLITVVIAVAASKVPAVLLAIYVAGSLLTFVAYAMDKAAARKGAWRTSENTLHMLSLLGGWPGAIFAQQKLRHKSQKRSFRMMFWLTVIINCGVLAWTFTPAGADAVRAVLAAII